MDYRHKIIAIISGLFFLFIVMFFIKKRSMHPSSVLLWLSVSFFLLSIPIFESVYKVISEDIIGFEDSRHIIYVVVIGFLLIHSFYLTIIVSQLSGYVKVLIKDLAILEANFKKNGNDK